MQGKPIPSIRLLEPHFLLVTDLFVVAMTTTFQLLEFQASPMLMIL